MTAADATPDRARRRLLIAGAGALAAAAGVAAGWWRLRPAETVAPEAVRALWGHTFDSPEGRPVPMAAYRGRPLLLNFWATWCPPCVEEMPLLDSFSAQQPANGLQVLGLAIDQPSAVRRFLARTPVRYPIGMAGLEGTELAKSLGNDGGGLPFTVVLAADGSVRQRRMGRLSRADLDQWASAG